MLTYSLRAFAGVFAAFARGGAQREEEGAKIPKLDVSY